MFETGYSYFTWDITGYTWDLPSGNMVCSLRTCFVYLFEELDVLREDEEEELPAIADM
jgi:hypothetical protein